VQLAFIGLGVMGRPMAGHLIAAGHVVSLHDHREVPRELVEAGGVPARSAAEAARGVEES
jgi:2-hydroxy-3-oxopropionate reductase